MTESISSEELQLLMAGYILHDLSEAEVFCFEQLMVANVAIAAELAEMQSALEWAYAPPEIQPPDRLRGSILEAYSTEQGILVGEKVSPLAQAKKRWRFGWGVAAAVAIAGLSVSNLMLWRSLRIAETQGEETEWVAVSLNPTEESVVAPEMVKVDPTNLEAVLQVESLPPLPPGQVYVLWTVLHPDAPFTTDEKNAILTGVFAVDGQNNLAKITLPSVYREPQWVKAIAITVEANDAPQQHNSSPILIGSLPP